ncbi:MAG: hypothetical protein JWM78_1973 [Verrucomicrobiaceae bacterium]|nr:hypothetical protein [Verrucomicrobiaceae bacterium]
MESIQRQTVLIDLLAGQHPNGKPVLEKVRALAEPGAESGKDAYCLLQSPLFVTGAACGDIIDMLQNNPGRFRVRERSGQLAVRVFCRDGVTQLENELTPAVEMLDGQLDVQSERALVYSIHVAVGFHEIEQVFDAHVGTLENATWSYGNVYDPETGAPLEWWEDLLNP